MGSERGGEEGRRVREREYGGRVREGRKVSEGGGERGG